MATDENKSINQLNRFNRFKSNSPKKPLVFKSRDRKFIKYTEIRI